MRQPERRRDYVLRAAITLLLDEARLCAPIDRMRVHAVLTQARERLQVMHDKAATRRTGGTI